MKALKPSAREKKRYLLVKGKNLEKEIPNAILEFVGVLGMSETGLKFIKTKKTKPNTKVISVNRKQKDKVIASLTIYNEKIVVEKVSGTLKGLGIK
jgi:RNase P/RNase MRP subunit POP5